MTNMISWLLGLVLLLNLWVQPGFLSDRSFQTNQPGLEVRFHPDGALQAGDLVSFEVFAPSGSDYSAVTVTVTVDDAQRTTIGPLSFQPDPIGRQYQAETYWAWDTSSLPPGEYRLQFELLPGGLRWQQAVVLAPHPTTAVVQTWQQAETGCCIIHYITGTAVERDLVYLTSLVDRQAIKVEQRLGVTFEKPVEINFIPRVVGHGGFASDQLYISYLDRNYAGTDLSLVLFHELTHMLDRQMGDSYRPSMLVEGLAVYLSGGHFKREALAERAAALLALDLYIPFDKMLTDFYATQHEAGYLEAGALVEFMAETWGESAYLDFHHDIQLDEGGTPQQAISQALQRHFGLGLPELERRYRDYLLQLKPTRAHLNDVHLTVDFYDTVRRYQQQLDPSAYFRQAWLPGAEVMRERGIVADYTRRPNHPANRTFEQLLVRGWGHLAKSQFWAVESLLYMVNRGLDAIPVRQLLIQLEGAETGASAWHIRLGSKKPHACGACGLP